MEDVKASTLLKPGLSIKPKVTHGDVRKILSDLYGLKCDSLKELNGYDDNNYYVKVQSDLENPHIEKVCEDGYIFKVTNNLDSEKPEVFHAQNQLLLKLQKSDITCPKPIRNRSGDYLKIFNFPSGKHIVRLLEYIPGSILHQVPCNNHLFYQVGKYAAQLDEALKDFNHSAYHTFKSVWMLESLPNLGQFLYAVCDERRKKIVQEIIDEFTRRVLSVSQNFSKGIIHADMNEQNIVVDHKNNQWNIKAILDFGDCHYDCYLFELAITMTYMMIQGGSIETGGHVLAGYSSVIKLPKDQLNLLKLCTCARLCQSLVMGAYSILQDPDNDYILGTAKHGWALLEQLWPQEETKLMEIWLKTAENYGIKL